MNTINTASEHRLLFLTEANPSNDGIGALTSIRRIASGFPFKEVQEPIISRGNLTPETLAQCVEFGLYMAAGIESGIF